MRLTVPPELIEAARTGDDACMGRLLETLWPHAYRLARSIIHNDPLAEDAAQEACAIVYRTIGSLKSTDAFRVWMYRIVAREAVRAAKRNAPLRLTLTPDAPAIEERLDVLRSLAALTPELRAVVVLTYYADLNSSEIAAVLGIPAATVRFRLSNARKRLEPMLDSADRFCTVTEVL